MTFPCRDLDFVERRLAWLERERIWPNGLRYLWTDAFGVVLLVSLYRELGHHVYLERAEWLVAEVERVLGRRHGIRIGEAPDRDGQYFHYLAKWLFALERLGEIEPRYRRRAIELARDIHDSFVVPGRGVWWKMAEDLSGPYPGYGFGALDAFDGWSVYRLLASDELARQTLAMRGLINASWRGLVITQDLGLGMMLWTASFHPDEEWAQVHRGRTLAVLDHMWIDPPGYFCRGPRACALKFAFTNYGVSLGLQAAGAWPERVERLHAFFDRYRSGDEYDREAITHVMACVAHFPGSFLPDRQERQGAGAAPASGRSTRSAGSSRPE